MAIHPITQTADHFCAADSFHKTNTSVEAEKLRDTSIVRQLRGHLNTRVNEQLYRVMNSSLYVLNAMSAQRYLFTLRLILHLRNEDLTCTQLKRAKDRCLMSVPCTTVTIGDDGRIQAGTKEVITSTSEKESRSPVIHPSEASTSEEGRTIKQMNLCQGILNKGQSCWLNSTIQFVRLHLTRMYMYG